MNIKDKIRFILNKIFNNKRIKTFSIFFVVLFFGLVIIKTNCFAIAGVGDFIDVAIGSIINGIAFLLYQLCRPIMFFFTSVIKMTGDFVNMAAVDTVWQVIRDIVNMTFIIAMLITAVYKMIGAEKKLPQGKFDKQILYILIGAFIINFSKVICGAFIDLTNLVSMMFVNSYGDAIGNIFSSIFKFNIAANVQSRTAPAVINLVFILALFAYALTILVYAVVRMIILAISTALSPLVVFMFFFPKKVEQMEKLDIKGQFFEFAIGGITVSFYLWVALMFLTAGGQGNVGLEDALFSGNSDALTAAKTSTVARTDLTDSTGDNYNEIPNAGDILIKIMGVVLLLTFQKSAMAMAKKAGFGMKDFVGKAVDSVSKFGMAPLDSVKRTAKEIGLSAKDAAVGGAKKWVGSSNNLLARGTNKVFNVAENLRKSGEASEARLAERAKKSQDTSIEGRHKWSEYQQGKNTEARKIVRDTKINAVNATKRVFQADRGDYVMNQILNSSTVPDAQKQVIKDAILNGDMDSGRVEAMNLYRNDANLKREIDQKYDEEHNLFTSKGRIATLERNKKDLERRMQNGEKIDKKDLDVIDAKIDVEKKKMEEGRTREELGKKEEWLAKNRGTSRDEVDALNFKNEEYKKALKEQEDSEKKLNVELNRVGIGSYKDYKDLEEKQSTGALTAQEAALLRAADTNNNVQNAKVDYLFKEQKSDGLKLTTDEENLIGGTQSSVTDATDDWTGARGNIGKAKVEVDNKRQEARGVAEKKKNEEWNKIKESQDKIRGKYINSSGQFDAGLINLAKSFDEEALKTKEGDSRFTLKEPISDFVAAVGLKIKEAKGKLNPLEDEILNSEPVKKKIKDFVNSDNKDNGFRKEWNGLLKDTKYASTLGVSMVSDKPKEKSATEVETSQTKISDTNEKYSAMFDFVREKSKKVGKDIPKWYVAPAPAVAGRPAVAGHNYYEEFFVAHYDKLSDADRENVDASAERNKTNARLIATVQDPLAPHDLRLIKGYYMKKLLKSKMAKGNADSF